jgi:PAS domain S-box-containing protein
MPHEAILHAVNYAALRFLHEPDWERSIQDILEHLADAAGVQRITIRQILRRQEGLVSLTLRHVFDRRGAAACPPLGSVYQLKAQDFEQLLCQIADPACTGQNLALPPSETPLNELDGGQAYQIRTALAAPLYVHEELWGLVFYSDLLDDSFWTEAERLSLQTAAGMMAAAIERQDARRRLESLVNSAPSILWEYDLANQVYIFISQQCEKILGYPRQVWLEGRDFWEAILHPADRKSVLEYSEKHIRQGKDFEHEYRMLAADGRVVWFHDTVNVVKESNQVRWLRGVKVDITNRKETDNALQEERSQAQRYLDTASVALAALDPQGTILMLNRWGCKLLGYEEEEVLGKNWFELFIPEEERQALWQHFELMTGSRQAQELEEKHENVVLTRSGERRIFAWTNNFLYDASGAYIGLLSSGDDITERRQTEQALRASEASLARAQTIAHTGSYFWNIARGEMSWSDELRRILGFEDEAPAYELAYQRIHPDDLPSVLEAARRTRQEQQAFDVEYRICLPDGRLRYIHDQAEVTFDQAGMPLAIFGTAQDITERKLADLLLEEHVQEIARLNEITQTALKSERVQDSLPSLAEQLRALVGSDLCYITLLDPEGQRVIHAAAAGRDEETYKPAIINARRTILENAVLSLGKALVIEDTAQDLEGLFDPALMQKFPAASLMLLPLQSGGSQTGNARQNYGAAILGYLASHTFSQTEIRRGEQAARQVSLALTKDSLLQQARRSAYEMKVLVQVSAAMRTARERQEIPPLIMEQVSELFQTWGVALVSKRSRGQLWVEAAQGGWTRYWQRTFDLGENAERFFETIRLQPMVIDDAPAFIHKFLPEEAIENYRTLAVVSLTTETGEMLGMLVICRSEPFSSFDLSLFKAIADICANALHRSVLYRNLEEQLERLHRAQTMLIQNEKLAALGGLVAGIAHELNNPLASIVLNAQILQSKPLANDVKEGLERIQQDAQRASKIVRGLLEFSRQRPPERRLVQVNEVVKDTLQLVNYELKSAHILVETDLDPHLPEIQADPFQLQQVMLNLINNGRDSAASQAVGVLRIQTCRAMPAEPSDRTSSTEAFIQVRITDNGPGIPFELTHRIFDPFFTTKEPGRGTGLGLSICHGIITEHGGRIWSESEPGHGATFIVELPQGAREAGSADVSDPQALPAQAAKAPPPAYTPVPLRQRAARLMIIDDETHLLKALQLGLEQHGYQVAAFANAADALLSTSANRYDFVICDLRMPEIDGADFYQMLILRRPELTQRVLFITGDSVSADARGLMERSHLPHLNKPFSLADLLKKLEDLSGA